MGSIYAQLQDTARDKLLPLDVMYETTYRCNLRCEHCYNAPSETLKEMTTAEACRALEQIAAAGGFILTFTGGEPLARPDFFEIAAAAKSYGFALALISNGTLIGDAAADALAALRFTDVSVTLYSMNPGIHDAITRAPGSQQRSAAALERLRARGIKTTMRSVIMKKNVEGYRELVDFAEARGIRYILDPGVSPRSDGDPAPLACGIGDRDLAGVYADELIKYPIDDMPRQGVMRADCDAARSICHIDPYGNIHPCIQLPIKLGNVLEQSFEEIWFHGETGKKLRDAGNAITAECQGCGLAGYCLRCSGMAFLEGRGFTGRSPSACRTAAILRDIVEKKSGQC